MVRKPKHDLPLEDDKLSQNTTDEASSDMGNEGCPNDLGASISDATGYSGTQDPTDAG
jgi:hypothetical protein